MPSVKHAPHSGPDKQPILSIRGSVPKGDADTFISEALHDVRVFMQEHHLAATGPPFSICRPRGRDVDIEAGWPTSGEQVASIGRIHAGALPRSLTGPHVPHAIDASERERYHRRARLD